MPGAVWVAYRDHLPGEIRDISVIEIPSDTGARTGFQPRPRKLHGDNWKINGCPVDGPVLGSDGVQAAAVWYTRGGGAGEPGARVLAALSPLSHPDFGAAMRIDDGNPLGRPTVQALGDGHFLAAWLENAGDGKAQVKLRSFERGRTMPSFVVTDVAAGRSAGFPRLLVAAGSIFVVW